ncbi:MAG: antitoxin family protein [Acidobacteriia bacterium]|nr:antitoxin family protein [Terriglobia bacterium]
MAQVSEAIYARGVLTPVEPLDIRENQRVRIIVEPLDISREDRAVALARLKAGIATMRFFSAGRLSSREERHDR